MGCGGRADPVAAGHHDHRLADRGGLPPPPPPLFGTLMHLTSRLLSAALLRGEICGSYQPCRGPVGGPSSSWHHSTPQRDPRALQTRHGRGNYTKTAHPEPQLKASTLKPVVSGEPPPSRHHASLAEDGLDRSTAPIGRPQTRVADSLCLLRLGVDALARSHTVQARIGRCMKPLVPGLHMSGLPCERSVGCASGLAMARARGAPVGDGLTLRTRAIAVRVRCARIVASTVARSRTCSRVGPGAVGIRVFIR